MGVLFFRQVRRRESIEAGEMRILVLTTAYPTPANIYQQAFVRARVRGYHERGYQVRVVSFSTKVNYELDGVGVETIGSWSGRDLREHFDIVVSHAPNLRGHLLFLHRHRHVLPPVAFTFHGHETLVINRRYPPPYPWKRHRWFAVQHILQNIYDRIKLKILQTVIERLRRQKKVLLIYVSHAFRAMALDDIGLPKSKWDDISLVIPNPVGLGIKQGSHRPSELLGDFLTIRPLDVSKMAVDLVVECARQNPAHTFHIYGEGEALKHLATPPNVVHFPGFIENDDIPQLLNRYRAALMPSRCDAQGVMMCEMAVTGMPVVGSDIAAHREALREFPRTGFLDNSNPRFDAERFLQETANLPHSDSKVFDQQTIISAEISAFTALIESSRSACG